VFGGPEIAWYWHTLFFWAIVAITGYLNIEFTAKTVVVISVLGLIIIMAFEGLVVFNGGPEGLSLESFTWDAFTSGSIGLGLLFSILVFIGFESTAIYREEVKDPRKTIPKATYLSVIIIGLVYMSATWCLIVSSGPSQAHAVAAENPSGMFSTAFGIYAGQVAVDVAMCLMIVTSLAALLSIHNVVARYCYSVGYDGALPRLLGRAHPSHHSPYIASMADSLVTLIAIVVFAALSLNPNYLYGRLAGTATIAILSIYLLTNVAIIFFFHRNPNNTKLWERAIAPIISTIGMSVVLWLAVANFDMLIESTWTTASLLLLLIWAVPVGGIVLAMYYRSRRPEIYQRIGRN
jgi:amino acid transporter